MDLERYLSTAGGSMLLRVCVCLLLIRVKTCQEVVKESSLQYCTVIIIITHLHVLKLKQDTFFMKQKGVAECFRKSGREAKSSQGNL